MTTRAAIPLVPVCSYTPTTGGSRAESKLGPSWVPRGSSEAILGPSLVPRGPRKKWSKQQISICAWEAKPPRANRGAEGRRPDRLAPPSPGVQGQGQLPRRRAENSTERHSVLPRGMSRAAALLVGKVGVEGVLCASCSRFQRNNSGSSSSSSKFQPVQDSSRLSGKAPPRVVTRESPRVGTTATPRVRTQTWQSRPQAHRVAEVLATNRQRSKGDGFPETPIKGVVHVRDSYVRVARRASKGFPDVFVGIGTVDCGGIKGGGGGGDRGRREPGGGVISKKAWGRNGGTVGAKWRSSGDVAGKRCARGLSLVRRQAAVNDQGEGDPDAAKKGKGGYVEEGGEDKEDDVAVDGREDKKTGALVPGGTGGGDEGGVGVGGGGGGMSRFQSELSIAVAQGDSGNCPSSGEDEELVAQNGDGGGRGVVADISEDLLSMLSSNNEMDKGSMSIFPKTLKVGDGSGTGLQRPVGESMIERNLRKRRERELQQQQQQREEEEAKKEQGQAVDYAPLDSSSPSSSSSSSSPSSSSNSPLFTVGMASEGEEGSSASSALSGEGPSSSAIPSLSLSESGSYGDDSASDDVYIADWYTMAEDERWLVRLDQNERDWAILERLVDAHGDEGGGEERGRGPDNPPSDSPTTTPVPRVSLDDRHVLWALVSYLLKREEESLMRLQAALSSGASDESLEAKMAVLSPFPPPKDGSPAAAATAAAAAARGLLRDELASIVNPSEEDDVAVRFLTLALRHQGMPLSDFIYDMEGVCISDQPQKTSLGYELELIRRIFLSRGKYPHLARLGKIKTDLIRRVLKPAGFLVESTENLPLGMAIFGDFEDVHEEIVIDENGVQTKLNGKPFSSSHVVGERTGGGEGAAGDGNQKEEAAKKEKEEVVGYWGEDGYVVWEVEEEEVVDLEDFRQQVQRQLDVMFPGLVLSVRPSLVDDGPVLLVGPANEFFTLSFPLWVKMMASLSLCGAATWMSLNLSGMQMLARDDVAPWLLAMVPAVLLSVIGGGWLARKAAALAHRLPNAPDPGFPLPSPLVGALGVVTTYKGVLSNRACQMDLSFAATLAMAGISAAAIALGSGSNWDSLSFALWGQAGQTLLVPETVVHHSATLTKLSEISSFGVLVGEHDESLLMMSPLALGGVLGLNCAAFGMIPTRRLDGARLVESALGVQIGQFVSDLVALTVAIGLLAKGSASLAASWAVWMLAWRNYSERLSTRDELTDPGLLRIGFVIVLLLGAGLVLIP
ncbi:hypothetical protein CBR_g59393, partial [Chara braunii]